MGFPMTAKAEETTFTRVKSPGGVEMVKCYHCEGVFKWGWGAFVYPRFCPWCGRRRAKENNE
jgi:hypothetical protein